MARLPSGTVTFLFTDIEGSTRRWEEQAASMRPALARHDAILEEAISDGGGYVFATGGDGFAVAFHRVSDALTTALEVQQSLIDEPWNGVALDVRMGVHTGEAEERNGDYFGPVVNKAARIMAAGHGGQVLVSRAAVEVARSEPLSDVTFEDLGEHRLKDFDESERIFQLCHPTLPREFGALRALDGRRTNLPADLSALVGREDDISSVVSLLAESRLVTLTGTGGVGKTRLGIAAARSAMDSYPGGVWFVELAPLTDGDLVFPTIARALGVERPALRPLEDAVEDAIGHEQMLFVLDNCEHLADAVASAAAFLLRAPHVRVLATSREILQLQGEMSWQVPSLGVPPPEASDVALVAESQSVVLFVSRVRAADSSFVLGQDNAEAVASICRRLDGIPLAIELAAARVRTLSVADLDRSLASTIDVLAGGGRESLVHHRTLRATIEWSHDLLGDEGKSLFNRLGVFAGGFTLEGASTLAGDEQNATAYLIEELVSKSMLSTISGAQHRFRMLETLRQFAVEQLDETELDSTRSAHLDWMVAVSQREAPKLMTDEQLATLATLHADLDDLREAMRWSLDSGRPEEGLRIASSLGRFWHLAAMQYEGGRWLEELLAAEPRSTALEMGRALTTAAMTLNRTGDDEKAIQYANEAIRLLEDLDEDQSLGWAQFYLGIASVEEGYTNLNEVERLWAASHTSFTAADYAPGIAFANLLLTAAGLIREPSSSLPAAEALVAAGKGAGNNNLTAHALEFVANARRVLGDLEESAAAVADAIDLHVEVENWACLAHCIEQGVGSYLLARSSEKDAAHIVGGTDALRLSLSTVEAPYERFTLDFYDWLATVEHRPELRTAREEGRSWSRDQLIERAKDYVTRPTHNWPMADQSTF